MNDRELLELAAKAAGMVNPTYMEIYQNKGINRGPTESLWNPLTDDGDALRLAVKLNLLDLMKLHVGQTSVEEYASDPYGCTRRAIVRAAAAIGKGMV